jgi:hypothetical protein
MILICTMEKVCVYDWNFRRTNSAMERRFLVTPTPVLWVPRLSREYNGRSVMLTTRPLLVSGCLWVSAIAMLLPPVFVCIGISRGAFTS